MHCVCTIKVIQTHGIYDFEDSRICNFCKKPLTEATAAAVARLLIFPGGQKQQRAVDVKSKEEVLRLSALEEKRLANEKVLLLKEKADSFYLLKSEYSQNIELIPVEMRLQIAILDNIQGLLGQLLATNEQILLTSRVTSKSSTNTAARLPAIAAGLFALSQDD